jgi:hypothetical protein
MNHKNYSGLLKGTSQNSLFMASSFVLLQRRRVSSRFLEVRLRSQAKVVINL